METLDNPKMNKIIFIQIGNYPASYLSARNIPDAVEYPRIRPPPSKEGSGFFLVQLLNNYTLTLALLVNTINPKINLISF